MTDIRFYHLVRTPLDRAIAGILSKALKSMRVVIKAGSDERVRQLDTALWTFDRASFIPHGTAADGSPETQPAYLTAGDEVPNGATLLILTDGAAAADALAFERICDMFDGNDEDAVDAARRRWKAAKEAGHTLSYWQEEGSGWVQKA